jgi:hypothetical protein
MVKHFISRYTTTVLSRVARWFVFKPKHPKFRIENDDTFNGNLHYFNAICNNILRPFGNVVVIWYIFPCFGILCQEKSGNPGSV